ncbi:filamentous hemagglutinin family protein [Microbacteriaceae bacterium K1510]|nr:filamentous hemagglutinin family protein [Microbacteriaceae bacterium K1510]
MSTPTAIFEGDILADTVTGQAQTGARPFDVTDGYKLGQTTAPRAGTLALGLYTATGLTNAYSTDVKFADVAAITAGLNASGALPTDRANTAWFNASSLSKAGLGGLTVATKNAITVDSDLIFANGAEVKFVAPVVDINADITARAGSIVVTNILKPDLVTASPIVLTAGGRAHLTLHDGATIDVRGVWSNALTDPRDVTGQAYVNGGSVTFNSTQNVTIAAGSSIDATSGAAILANAKTKGGKGGNVTLIADATSVGVASNGGTLVLDGEVKAYGVNGGGRLTIESGPAIVIGGQALETNGVLRAGEKAPANLTAAEAFIVRAGEVLPADYFYTKTLALPGEALGGAPQFSATAPVVLAQSWTPPAPSGFSYTLIVDGVQRAVYAWALPTFPAGARITGILGASDFPSAYVVPGNVFPAGIPITPSIATIAAGKLAPVDVTFAAGTQIGAGAVLSQSVAVKPLLQLSSSRFQRGFSQYDINGHQGIVVASGATVDVAMPVYQFTDASYRVPSGADPTEGVALWTPPQHLEDPLRGTLLQRRGADLTLRSTDSVTGGPITVGTGASVTVDPGRSIAILGAGKSQIVVDGALNAWGGSIEIDIVRVRADVGDGIASARSIWIGDHATLDVAARAVTATDLRGRRYGAVVNGGTISIGGGLDWEDAGKAVAADAFVVIRPGAVLDASGTSAVIDLPGLDRKSYSTVTVASDGGSIILKSNNGLHIDGTLRARAGGAGAAGGTLALALETPNYLLSAGVDDAVRMPREIVFAQIQGGSLLPASLLAGEASDALGYGVARFGVDKIEAGGFGGLSVLVNGLLSFDGDTSLRMGQSLRLYASAFSLSQNAAANTQVSLAAPYLRMAGTTRAALDHYIMPTVTVLSNGNALQPTAAGLAVAADMIDIRDLVGFGARASIAQNAGSLIVERRGFAAIDLASSGDLRFLKNVNGGGAGRAGGITTEFAAPGNLVMTAAQIYPATEVTAQIKAGDVLSVKKAAGATPDAPWSVFGKLYLDAETVIQGGVVRAPGGAIEIGRSGHSTTLLPGSITSVSMVGLVLPYGGTVDGLTYRYDGSEVTFLGLVTDNIQSRTIRGISIGGAQIAVEAGAVLDLSGGGDILGAGFVSGRGGSIDVLRYALADANPGFGYSASGNKVYAIVPHFKGGYAPFAPDAVNPAVGQQVVIPAGVPGLAAGRYTLLPATYALLPGAFRVEVADATPVLGRAVAVGSGSYVAAAQLAIANTAIRTSLPTQVILTPGTAVRAHSNYNETSYAAFGSARAQELGWARPRSAADAGNLSFVFNLDDTNSGSALRFDGTVLQTSAKGGAGGQVSVRGLTEGAKMEIMAPGAVHQAGYISIAADELNAIGASRLVIGGSLLQANGDNGRGPYPGAVISVQTRGGELIVRSGVVLSAAEVLLVSGYRQQNIVVEAGASIDTLGRGAAPYDSSAGYLFDPGVASVVAVSNGWLEFLPPRSDIDSLFGGGNITIGTCGTAVCTNGAGLYSEGTIAFSSQQTIGIADMVRYGTKNLVLGVSTVNIGSEASLADAAGRNVLMPGLAFNQDILSRLLAGNRGTGIPKLESLILTARQSVNFYGTVNLSTIDPLTGQSSLKQLVLSTPAIYGYGNAGDVATLTTGSLVWTGVSQGSYENGRTFVGSAPPGAVIPGGAGTGHSTLNLIAETIELGYADRVRADNQVNLDRLILGFGTVNLNASKRIGGNAKGTLSVYEAQGAYVAGTGYSYTGGNLNLLTPLLTGGAGSVTAITAGSTLNVVAPQGADLTQSTNQTLGATLNLKGETINVASAVVLPSGKLGLSATGDITLTDGARIDMSGRAIGMFDTTQYSWGGDVSIESAHGNVLQAAGAVIDLSAENNQAGRLTVVALDENAGHVTLVGAIRGVSSGRYDTGAGVLMGYLSGRIEVRGQTIDDFAGLNQRLTAGGIFGERSFQLKQGDLVVGDELRANTVNLSVDGGRLTVAGRIDASGERVGAIRLAGRDGVTLGASAVLDAHGTVLRVDSDGKPIDAPNRAIVELTGSHGMITLASGATIDLRAADGVARGTLTLNASRQGGTGANGAGDGANDIGIDASGPLVVRGARSIVVNGFRTYSDAPLATEDDVNGRYSQVITQGYLDSINDDSEAFIAAALGNASLRSRLSGLSSYQDAFHLRPGVEITGDTTDRDLRIGGDLDLSRYRYNSINSRFARTGVYGSGEPGSLIIRGGSNLDIYGSINDGFEPIDTPDGNGWVLKNGVEPYASPTVLPAAVTLKGALSGTTTAISVRAQVSLNYDIPIRATTLRTGMVIPIDVVTSGALSLPAGTVLRADVTLPGGTILNAGTILNSATALPPGTRLGAGSLVPTSLGETFGVQAMTVSAGTPLNIFAEMFLNLSTNVTLKAGAFIPSNSSLEFMSGTEVDLRPTGPDGKQGKSYVVAPMLVPGSLSWDISLVAGGDLAAADRRMLRTKSDLGDRGNMTLSDLHYMPDVTFGVSLAPMITSVIRTGTGDLSLLAGGNYNQISLYGIYTAGTQSAPILDENGANPYNLPRGKWSEELDWMTFQRSVLGMYFGSYSPEYEALVTGDNYQAWYPEHGGNLLVAAQGNMAGAIQNGASYPVTSNLSSLAGNWLWRQGGEEGGQKTAWWINFGTYASPYYFKYYDFVPQLPAFSGFGALGGGNVTVRTGGDAGVRSSRGGSPFESSQGLNIAVGSTGRVLADGSIVKTGGGDISVEVGGAINPLHRLLNASGTRGLQNDLNGTIVNLRGVVDIRAGSIGRIDLTYGSVNATDPRAPDAFAANKGVANGGMVLVLGDAPARFAARGDLVLGGVVDAGLGPQVSSTPYIKDGVVYDGGGYTAFPLWTSATALDLFSAGGNLTPIARTTAIGPTVSNDWGASLPLPARMHVVAASGSIYLDGGGDLVPGKTVQVEFLAGQSIYGGGAGFHPSGANPADMISPQKPYFYAGWMEGDEGFAYSPPMDGAVALNLHGAEVDPLRFYAVNGDLIGLTTGQLFPASATNSARYYAAKPVRMQAGQDIVNAGGFFLHNNTDDVSVISAGRDIIYANVQIAGPGVLELSAGHNIYQADKGSITSIGAVVPGDNRSGASIAMQAGGGAGGPDYARFAALYLDPANLAVTGTPLADQPGKVAKTYEKELAAWLKQRYGFEATSEGEGRTYFATLAPEQQRIFLRTVYFAELKASGREYNDASSSRHGSYLRGRNVIAALFPDDRVYSGDITMFGGSGVKTLFGGDIQMLMPGGRTVIGVEGLIPPSTAGVVTQGAGDIQMYAKGSILLGLSRIMTTFGGNILAWSAEGDINAGRGAKTTVVYTPPKRVYDSYGNITLSPTAPSSGAGIATLQPIPDVAAGDVDLIAPLGTIDAGEAGVRSSGNVNLAAFQIVNAANIQAQGTTTGIPTVQAPNIGGLTQASNAAGAAAQQATTPAQNGNAAQPSIIIVEVLGFGGEENGGGREDIQRRAPRDERTYNINSPYQILGVGDLTDDQVAGLAGETRNRNGR